MAKTGKKKRRSINRRLKKLRAREAVILSAAAVLMVICVLLILYIPRISEQILPPPVEESSVEEQLTVTCAGTEIPYLERTDGLYVDFASLNTLCLGDRLFIDQAAETVFHTTVQDGIQKTAFSEIPMEAVGDAVYVQLDWAADVYGFTDVKESEKRITIQKAPEEETPQLPMHDLQTPVVLGWFQDYTGEYTEDKAETVAAGEGVMNVFSPTWFSLTEEGTFQSFANAEWVSFAHEKGYQVWAHADNGMDDARTYEAIRTEEGRQALIQELLVQCQTLMLDGINLDFEMLSAETAAYYVEFVRELGAVLRPEGYILSIDVMVPQSWSAFYRRDLLAAACDYVIVMAYDEHYNGSDAGSVASMPFTEEAVADMLELTDPDRLILGIPFYARIWYVGEETTTEAWSMNKVAAYLEEHELVSEYDPETGQDYVSRQAGSVTEQIWIENAMSVGKRLELASAGKLSGVAIWKLGLESEDIWPVMADYAQAAE